MSAQNPIHLTDVTLRDGLQMESTLLETPVRLALLKVLLACGYERIELTSFSHPKWMPQFKESDAFTATVFETVKSQVEWMAFVPNERGLERLLKHPIGWVSTFIATSEKFNEKNVNTSVTDTIEATKKIIASARAAKRKVRVYVSTVWGCPYEGEISEGKAMGVLEKIASLGADEVALSDTIGVAPPGRVRSLVKAFATHYPLQKTALHLHNTYGLAVSSALAGYEAGVTRFDGSTGGIGGCPYAKGATGNVALEELRYAFFREGILKTFPENATREALVLMKSQGLGLRSRLNEIWEKGGALYGLQ